MKKWNTNGTVIQDKAGYPIAQVWPDTRLSSDDSLAAMATNARLIAAAPALLAACEDVLGFLGRHRHDLSHLGEAGAQRGALKAAIEAAKA